MITRIYTKLIEDMSPLMLLSALIFNINTTHFKCKR
jgi:hypothetical protein